MLTQEMIDKRPQNWKGRQRQFVRNVQLRSDYRPVPVMTWFLWCFFLSMLGFCIGFLYMVVTIQP